MHFLEIQSLAAKICPPMPILSPFELEFSPLVANVQDATLWCAPARVLLRDIFLGSPSLPRWRLPSQQSLSKPRFRPEYKTQLLHEITVEAKTLRLQKSVGNRQLHVRPFVHCCNPLWRKLYRLAFLSGIFSHRASTPQSTRLKLMKYSQLDVILCNRNWVGCGIVISTSTWVLYCVIGSEYMNPKHVTSCPWNLSSNLRLDIADLFFFYIFGKDFTLEILLFSWL